MGATFALTALVLHTADQECGRQVEPGAPDSYCQIGKGGVVMAGTTLLAGSLLLPPAGAALGGGSAGGSFGSSVLGALVGLAGGALLAVPASALNDGASYIALVGGVVAGSVIGYELSVPGSDVPGASLLPKSDPLRVRARVLSEGACLTLGGTF